MASRFEVSTHSRNRQLLVPFFQGMQNQRTTGSMQLIQKPQTTDSFHERTNKNPAVIIVVI